MKKLKVFIILQVVINIINKNNKNIEERNIEEKNIEEKNTKIYKMIECNSNKVYFNKESLFSNIFNYSFFKNIDFPKYSNFTHMSLFLLNKYTHYIKLSSKYVNKKIILDNKIFNYKLILNKDSDKVILLNPGVAIFSDDDNLSLYHFLDDLKNKYNIIILYRNYTNLKNTEYFYEPFDISKYLDLFIKNIILEKNFKSIYLLGLSGGCLTILKYLLSTKNILPAEIKSCFFISCSPSIDKNILTINNLLSTRLKNTIVNEINKFPNNYNINTKLSLYDTIGIIGYKNNNMKNSNEYYEYLDFDLNILQNISIPIVFLNSLDDGVANFKYIHNNLKNILKSRYVSLIVTKYGSHALFFNKKKDFLSYSISYVFDNF